MRKSNCSFNTRRFKTELTARIRQIIADKLAFTAPSITATIQEEGHYTSSIAYEQYGEWRGTLLRKNKGRWNSRTQY